MILLYFKDSAKLYVACVKFINNMEEKFAIQFFKYFSTWHYFIILNERKEID